MITTRQMRDIASRFIFLTSKQVFHLTLSVLFIMTSYVGVAREMIHLDLALNRTIAHPMILTNYTHSSAKAPADRIVKDVVVNEKGEPMIGVNILAKGTITGTTTDTNGEFSLNVADNVNILVVSFIGYATQEVPIN